MHDVEHILCNGKIDSKEYKKQHGQWAYVVKGQDLEGDDGGVVAAIVLHYRCVVITVLS